MTNEFTVIKDAGDLGLSTYYFVLNKQDSLITYYEIASMRTDGSFWYEMSAKLFGKDTISMFLSDARRPVGSVKEPAEPFVKLRSLILGKTGVKAIMLEEIPETETVDSSKIDHCR